MQSLHRWSNTTHSSFDQRLTPTFRVEYWTGPETIKHASQCSVTYLMIGLAKLRRCLASSPACDALHRFVRRAAPPQGAPKVPPTVPSQMSGTYSEMRKKSNIDETDPSRPTPMESAIIQKRALGNPVGPRPRSRSAPHSGRRRICGWRIRPTSRMSAWIFAAIARPCARTWSP